MPHRHRHHPTSTILLILILSGTRLHLLLYDALLPREILQRIVAVILVKESTLAQAFGLVLHLLDDRCFLLWVLW